MDEEVKQEVDANEEGLNKEVIDDKEIVDNKDKKKNKKVEELTTKLNQAMQSITDLQNELMRSKADLVNYRKRKDEDVSRMLVYANEDLIKDLLTSIDNFERAIKLDSDDNLDDALSKFLEGFKMIYCNIVNVLEQYGLKAIDGSNKPFDPTYHQAVLLEHRDGVLPGMVLEVLQKGYLLKNKVIRPAMVRVSE